MDAIEKAFKLAKRDNFVREEHSAEADLDVPLPIGFGQTISQPTTVRMMLEWLEPQAGDKMLDIGSGSGWTTALLGNIAGPKGRVYAVEKIPELVEFGRDNCARLGLKNVEFHTAGREYGLPEFGPYDRILVSASAVSFPDALLKQLAPGGKLVIPVRSDIVEIEKTEDNKIESKIHPGFVFVPLV